MEMLQYNVSAQFENSEDNYNYPMLSYEQVCSLLPVSLHGAVRLMMHPGDKFTFESATEKTAWQVEAV